MLNVNRGTASVSAVIRCAVIALALCAVPAFANDDMNTNNQASISLRWKDAKGKAFKHSGQEVLPKLEKMVWVWSQGKSSTGHEVPALRVWLNTQLPENWKITQSKATGADLATTEMSDADADRVVLDLRATDSNVKYRFVTADGGKTVDLGLHIKVDVTQPYVITKPECQGEGLNLVATKTHSKNLYVGFSCKKTGEGVAVTTIRSLDSKWTKKTAVWARNAVIAETLIRHGDTKELGVTDRHGSASLYSVHVATGTRVAEKKEEPTQNRERVSSVMKGIWDRFHLRRVQGYGNAAFQFDPGRNSFFVGARYVPQIDLIWKLAAQPWIGGFGMRGSNEKNYAVMDYGVLFQLNNILGPLTFDVGGGGLTSFQRTSDLEMSPLVAWGLEYGFDQPVFGVIDRVVFTTQWVFEHNDTLMFNYGLTFKF